MAESPDPSRAVYLREELRWAVKDVCDALWACRERVQDEAYDRVDLREDEQHAAAPLFGRGFTLTGTGLGRVVLRFPSSWPEHDYVVKLTRFGTDPLSIGRMQNRSEYRFYRAYHDTDALLAPIVDWPRAHYPWLVMPYGTHLTEYPEATQEDYRERVEDSVSTIPGLQELEVTTENVIVIDDTPYLADYGRVNDDEISTALR